MNITRRLGSLIPVLCASILVLAGGYAEAKSKSDPQIRSPLGCRDVGYQFDLQVLEILPRKEGDDQSFYV